MLRTIGESFAAEGHEVHVFASRPSYGGAVETAPKSEELGSLKVRRCWVFQENRNNSVLRAMNVVLYCLALFIEIIRLRPDVVTASTFPPVVAAWTASLAARLTGAKFVYHVQDIHPEVSQISGGRLGLGLPFRILRWLDNRTLRRATSVITLSDDMISTLKKRRVPIRHIKKIDNFALELFGSEVPPKTVEVPDVGYRVIFAGNLGRFQDLLLLSEGVARCFEDHPELELLFLGSGAVEAELKKRWGTHPQVRFLPFRPLTEVRQIIAGSDLGLVSLSPGMSAVAKPSKLLTYEALGLPVLILTEFNSAQARDIEASNVGFAARTRSPEGVEDALRRALADTHLKENAQILAKQVDRQADAISGWIETLGELH